MIESIDVMCRIWGIQKRRILLGRSDAGFEDGWSRETILAKIREMQLHAGSTRGMPAQRFAETYTDPDALAIHRAAQGMPETLAVTLFVHYVIPQSLRLTAKRKAAILNHSLRDYWINLDRAHHWLAARVQSTSPPAVLTRNE